MKKTVAIGIRDFETMRINGGFHIDKTEFIREWRNGGDAATLMGIHNEKRGGTQMKNIFGKKNGFAMKLAAVLLCVFMLSGLIRVPAFATEADDSHRLVDIYCSQTAKDALGYEQLQTLVDLIVTSIEPQAVNLLIERFPCFKEAAEKGELGQEIGLYIYFEEGDQDGTEWHENVAPGSYAYVHGFPVCEDGKGVFKYMIGIDAEAISETDEMGNAVLDMSGPTRIQVDTTFCHELFHAFMQDYNRVGMTGYIDIVPFETGMNTLFTEEEAAILANKTGFPFWFIEGLAGCVGNIYPADLNYFHEYHYDPGTQQYLGICTKDQLCRMYTRWNSMEDGREQLYDLEASLEYSDDQHADAAVYVSGYMACLYLADLEYRELKGASAMAFDQNGDVASISSEMLREGLSAILTRLHQGETLDEVILAISGGTYRDTDDFEKRFIKGAYNGEKQDYSGDPESLSFCVGYLNYMSRLDALDPEAHPVGSMLMDDFGSMQPSPLEEDCTAASDFYRFVEKDYPVKSTVPNEAVRDGGTSFSGRYSFEEVLESLRATLNQ